MSAPLIIPDHIKQARLAAINAGIPCGTDDTTTAVLLLAATAYARIPQVNKAEMLRQDLARTQHELENVSSELSSERKHIQRLESQLAGRPLSKPARKEVSALMQANHNLRLQLEALLPQGATLEELAPIRGPKMKALKQELSTLRNQLKQAQENLAAARLKAKNA